MSARAQEIGSGHPHWSRVDRTVAAIVLVVAGLGWWWSVRMTTGMTSGGGGHPHAVSFGAFLLAWVVMMAAMMLPAIVQVLSLYRRAAAQGRLAPVPFFGAGYLAVWAATAVPAYAAWRALQGPVAGGATWAARLAALVLLAAAAWQVTPLKAACLRHCRSPLSFFLRHAGGAGRPLGALRMGGAHGLFCLGCCWALMAILVALGSMNPAWMALVAGLVFAEKNAAMGERLALGAAVVFAAGGVAVLVEPGLLTALT